MATTLNYMPRTTVDLQFHLDWLIIGDAWAGAQPPYFAAGSFAIGEAPPPVPISNWALYLGILLMGIFIVLLQKNKICLIFISK